MRYSSGKHGSSRRCIDELAVDLIDRESGVLKVSNGKGQLNGFTGRQISFMDVFSSVFNNAATVCWKLSLSIHYANFIQIRLVFLKFLKH